MDIDAADTMGTPKHHTTSASASPSPSATPSAAAAVNNTQNNTSAAVTQNNTQNTRDFFVIQSCWFSGPTTNSAADAPADYLRLLDVQQDAEEIACLSAHAFSKSRECGSGKSVSGASAAATDSPVRTIVLPNDDSTRSGGYAFFGSGKIFWVRRVQAVVVDSGNSTFTAAHAVVTEHVIGGTGNRNSRRGAEQNTGRIFCGAGGASGHAAAVAAQPLQQHALQQGAGVSVRVTWLPVGKPRMDNYEYLQEWPNRHLWRPQDASTQLPVQKQQRDDSEYSDSHSWSQQYTQQQQQQHYDAAEQDANHVFGNTTDSMNMDTAMLPPPAAKRQCRQHHAVPSVASDRNTNTSVAWPM